MKEIRGIWGMGIVKKKNRSLIQGDIKLGMLSFAFPIFLGQLFQQLYNIVDAIIVGNYIGENALAAVTSTVPLIFLIVVFWEDYIQV